MREVMLRDFFLGRATAEALAKGVLDSVKQIGPIHYSVEIEDMETGFSVTREMLVLLCDAVLSGKFPAHELSTIGFALEASDKFTWEGEDVVGKVIDDWACPEINYPLTHENIQSVRTGSWIRSLIPKSLRPDLHRKVTVLLLCGRGGFYLNSNRAESRQSRFFTFFTEQRTALNQQQMQELACFEKKL